ncbi:MAG: hypothetical protein ACI9OJ_001351 [Myxococcota bacterium]|jgi:hypothetical protein
MRFRIPKTSLTVDVPAGWEATHGRFGLFVYAPGTGANVETKRYENSSLGTVDITALIRPAGETLPDTCRQLWTKYTHVAPEHCDVVFVQDGVWGYEYTNGVDDITSWLVKGPLPAELTIDFSYVVPGRPERTLSVADLDALMKHLVSGLALESTRGIL